MKSLSFFLLTLGTIFSYSLLYSTSSEKSLPSVVSSSPPPNEIVQFCFNPTGECWEVDLVRRYGHDWRNACCSDFHLINDLDYYDCTDDCSPDPAALNQPPPSIEETQAHFNLSDGRQVWIVEDEELSEDSFDEESDEYEAINSIPEWSWLDSSDNIAFVSININANSYAIVERLSDQIQLREKDSNKKTKIPERVLETFKRQREMRLEYWKKNAHLYKIELYPNPVQLGETVEFKTLMDPQSIVLFDSGGREVRPELRKTAENTYSFKVKKFVGVVYVKVYTKGWGVRETKLVVSDD